MIARRLLYTLIIGSFFSVQGKLELTHPKMIHNLYQLMKDVHEILVTYEIPYWIDSGTTLGAVRHKGIIPWDNDLDICIPIEYESRYLEIVNHFEELGYKPSKQFFGSPNQTKHWGYALQADYGAHIDIFLAENRDGKIWYYHEHARELWGTRGDSALYMTHDELYPLKLYQFGSFFVYGPNNAKPYLLASYGEDCLNVGRMQINHQHGFEKEGTALTNDLMGPALPLGPLSDRVCCYLKYIQKQ